MDTDRLILQIQMNKQLQKHIEELEKHIEIHKEHNHKLTKMLRDLIEKR